MSGASQAKDQETSQDGGQTPLAEASAPARPAPSADAINVPENGVTITLHGEAVTLQAGGPPHVVTTDGVAMNVPEAFARDIAAGKVDLEILQAAVQGENVTLAGGAARVITLGSGDDSVFCVWRTTGSVVEELIIACGPIHEKLLKTPADERVATISEALANSVVLPADSAIFVEVLPGKKNKGTLRIDQSASYPLSRPEMEQLSRRFEKLRGVGGRDEMRKAFAREVTQLVAVKEAAGHVHQNPPVEAAPPSEPEPATVPQPVTTTRAVIPLPGGALAKLIEEGATQWLEHGDVRTQLSAEAADGLFKQARLARSPEERLRLVEQVKFEPTEVPCFATLGDGTKLTRLTPDLLLIEQGDIRSLCTVQDAAKAEQALTEAFSNNSMQPLFGAWHIASVACARGDRSVTADFPVSSADFSVTLRDGATAQKVEGIPAAKAAALRAEFERLIPALGPVPLAEIQAMAAALIDPAKPLSTVLADGTTVEEIRSPGAARSFGSIELHIQHPGPGKQRYEFTIDRGLQTEGEAVLQLFKQGTVADEQAALALLRDPFLQSKVVEGREVTLFCDRGTFLLQVVTFDPANPAIIADTKVWKANPQPATPDEVNTLRNRFIALSGRVDRFCNALFVPADGVYQKSEQDVGGTPEVVVFECIQDDKRLFIACPAGPGGDCYVQLKNQMGTTAVDLHNIPRTAAAALRDKILAWHESDPAASPAKWTEIAADLQALIDAQAAAVPPPASPAAPAPGASTTPAAGPMTGPGGMILLDRRTGLTAFMTYETPAGAVTPVVTTVEISASPNGDVGLSYAIPNDPALRGEIHTLCEKLKASKTGPSKADVDALITLLQQPGVTSHAVNRLKDRVEGGTIPAPLAFDSWVGSTDLHELRTNPVAIMKLRDDHTTPGLWTSMTISIENGKYMATLAGPTGSEQMLKIAVGSTEESLDDIYTRVQGLYPILADTQAEIMKSQALLALLVEHPEFELVQAAGLTFQNLNILPAYDLSNATFKNCEFVDCNMHIVGSNINFLNCRAEHCIIDYDHTGQDDVQGLNWLGGSLTKGCVGLGHWHNSLVQVHPEFWRSTLNFSKVSKMPEILPFGYDRDALLKDPVKLTKLLQKQFEGCMVNPNAYPDNAIGAAMKAATVDMSAKDYRRWNTNYARNAEGVAQGIEATPNITTSQRTEVPKDDWEEGLEEKLPAGTADVGRIAIYEDEITKGRNRPLAYYYYGKGDKAEGGAVVYFDENGDVKDITGCATIEQAWRALEDVWPDNLSPVKAIGSPGRRARPAAAPAGAGAGGRP